MTDYTRPHSIEAERAVLGALVQMPERLVEVSELLLPAHFYRPDHRKVYQAMLELHRQGKPADRITLPEYVMDHPDEDAFGGVEYVLELEENCPAPASVRHYAETVARLARNRFALDALEKARHEAARRADTEDIVHHLQGVLERIEHDLPAAVPSAADGVVQAIKELDDPGTRGEMTGFRELDDILGGLRPGDLTILAARPGMGKSALAGQIAWRYGSHGRRVHIQSLEMPLVRWVERAACAEAKVPLKALKQRPMGPHTRSKLLPALEWAGRAAIAIDDKGGRTPAQVLASIRRSASKLGGLDLVVVDYIQLIRSPRSRMARHEVIGEFTGGLKAIAKDLGCHVIGLAQVHRRVDQRDWKRPALSDLKDAGSIEQDADGVVFIYREGYHFPDEADLFETEMIVAKNRHGETGTAKARFVGEYVRFENQRHLKAVQ